MTKYQLLEIYTESTPCLSVTSLGFFTTVDEARINLEDFLREEVLHVEEGEHCDLTDEFIIYKDKTVYVNGDGSFEWHIKEVTI